MSNKITGKKTVSTMCTYLIVGCKLFTGCNTKLHGLNPHFFWHVCVLNTGINREGLLWYKQVYIWVDQQEIPALDI